MEVVVLIKATPEAETRLRPNSQGTGLEVEGVKWVLAGYDESAVEQALLLREAVPGSKVRAVAAGPAPRTEEVLRSALALGVDSATWVELPEASMADAAQVGVALAEAVKTGPVDLLLAGKQSSDGEAGLVAGVVAERLGLPSYASVVDLRWDGPSQTFRFACAVEGGLERWKSPAPLAVGLQQAWNDPRTAKLPNILKSRKAPIAKVVPAAGLPARVRRVAFRLPAPRTGAQMISGATPEDAARELARRLKEEAKVLP